MQYHLAALSLAAGAALAMLATATFPSSARAERPLLFHSDKIVLKASPQEAWDAIKTFDQIHKWHPATENTVMLVGTNGVPLAVREFQLKGGGFVISELLEYREDVKWYRYRIIKTNLPMKGYEAEMHVEPGPDGGSIVTWRGQFQRAEENPPAGQDDAATMKMVETIFRSGLENIQKITSH
jgi:Polyketide cyclase / dehydrase and lipid transport